MEALDREGVHERRQASEGGVRADAAGVAPTPRRRRLRQDRAGDVLGEDGAAAHERPPRHLQDRAGRGTRAGQPGDRSGASPRHTQALAHPRARRGRTGHEGVHRRPGAAGIPDLRADRPTALGACRAALGPRQPRGRHAARRRVEVRGGGEADRAPAAPGRRTGLPLRREFLSHGHGLRLRPPEAWVTARHRLVP